MLAVMSRPEARAASMRATISGSFPQFDLPEILRCQMTAGIFASREMRKVSSSAASIWLPSERMWVA